MAIKPEGGGGKALTARPLREELSFCGFPNQKSYKHIVLINARNFSDKKSKSKTAVTYIKY